MYYHGGGGHLHSAFDDDEVLGRVLPFLVRHCWSGLVGIWKNYS